MLELELETAKNQVTLLSNSLLENEKAEQLYELQASTLKNEILELQRTAKRSDVDLAYLKNVIVKYMETGDDEVSQ